MRCFSPNGDEPVHVRKINREILSSYVPLGLNQVCQLEIGADEDEPPLLDIEPDGVCCLFAP